MSRLINADDLLRSISTLLADRSMPHSGKDVAHTIIGIVKALAENESAPTLATGDAISRKAALQSLHWEASRTSIDSKSRSVMVAAIKGVEELPSLPAPLYGVEDVREGVEWRQTHSADRFDLYRTYFDGAFWRLRGDGVDECRLTPDQIADLLNGAARRGEKITWPPDHPRAGKPEPSLLEAAKALLYAKNGGNVEHQWCDLRDAIAREEQK